MRAFTAVLPALLLLGLAAPAQAATFHVDTLLDSGDANIGDGFCAASGGACSVRAAIQQADAGSTPDEIVLGPGVHSLNSSLSATNNDVTIRGAGAGATTINQTSAGQRVLFLSNSTAVIRDLALTGGSTSFAGAGLYVDVTGSQSVLAERVLIANNEVSATGGVSPFGGGTPRPGRACSPSARAR